MQLSIQLSPPMHELHAVQGVRYRIAVGGRGGSKSYGNGDKALKRMVMSKCDIVVCREYHNTIKKSVHKLLKSRIFFHKMGHLFKITDNDITYLPNGSILTYQHLHDNEDEVKGLEGNTICWIFEGHSLKRESWKYLNPTIRRTPGMSSDPEIWIEFNPDSEDDFVYKKFIIGRDPRAVVQWMTYLDNPWCPQDIKDDAEYMRQTDFTEYQHVYLGHPRNAGSLVYPGFDEKEHVRAVDLNRIEHVGNFFMGQDPHTVYYPACVWLGRVARGDGTFDYYWYNEFPTRSMFSGKFYYEERKSRKCNMTLRQRASLFRTLDSTIDRTYHGINILARGIDTRFAKGSGTSSATLSTRGIIIEMADPKNGGLVFETPKEYMIDGQRQRIREAMDWQRDLPISDFNMAHMYVLPHCENIIDTFRFHRFDKDGKEREDEKRKDFSDAMKIAMATEQDRPHVDRNIRADEIMARAPDMVEQLLDAYGYNHAPQVPLNRAAPLARS